MTRAFDPEILPPVPCLDALPDPHSFLIDHVASARPVVLKGLVSDWPAVQAGMRSTDELMAYLRARDLRIPTTVLEASPTVKGQFFYGPDMRDFNFHRRTKSISEGIDALERVMKHPNPPAIYIQSAPLAQYMPQFLGDNANPLLPPSIGPRIWIGNATRAQTHNDHDHNIACVVAGHRRFVLFPPEQVSNLYIGPQDHTPSGRPISLANLEAPDFDRFPRFRQAIDSAMVAELEPGDAIFIPKYWWHHVRASGNFNVLVNYWWGGVSNPVESPTTTFLSALIALKDLPPSETAYWKAMFDHYIFQTDGDPAGHIPRTVQGGLGKMDGVTRASLIRTLQAILR